MNEEIFNPDDYYAQGGCLDLGFGKTSVLACDQPRIGIEICFNDYRKFWKPFVVLTFGRKGLQFGWIWGEMKGGS